MWWWNSATRVSTCDPAEHRTSHKRLHSDTRGRGWVTIRCICTLPSKTSHNCVVVSLRNARLTLKRTRACVKTVDKRIRESSRKNASFHPLVQNAIKRRLYCSTYLASIYAAVQHGVVFQRNPERLLSWQYASALCTGCTCGEVPWEPSVYLARFRMPHCLQ